jgi:hypothetical protein
MTRVLLAMLLMLSAGCCIYAQESPSPAKASVSTMRDLDWDTYLDKVQGAWMGKMIGVTFGQPWKFQYQNTPIGFDITDWPLSATRMKDYRAPRREQAGTGRLGSNYARSG